MAKARRVVNIVGAEQPRHLLRDVIRLIGESAGSVEEGESLGRTLAQVARNALQSFVPAHAMKTRFAAPAKHGIREPAKIPQIEIGKPAKGRYISQRGVIERGHGIDAQKFQAGHAQVHARHGVVAKSVRTERTSVAYAVTKNPPRVG